MDVRWSLTIILGSLSLRNRGNNNALQHEQRRPQRHQKYLFYHDVIIVVTGAIGGTGLTPAGPVLVRLLHGNIAL